MSTLTSLQSSNSKNVNFHLFLTSPPMRILKLNLKNSKNLESKRSVEEKVDFFLNIVAVCIMSGGQGTRLGFDHPKGMFNLGLQSGLTLFGFFANRLARLN